MDNIIKIIQEHIKSPGFQKRWRNIYWPAIKWAISYIYNKPIELYAQKSGAQKNFTPGEPEQKTDAIDAKEAKKIEQIEQIARGKVEPVPYEDAVDIMRSLAPETQHEQGEIGSCVSWACVNMTRVYMRSLYGKSPELAHMDIYADRQTPGLDGGMYPDNALNMLKNRGIALYLNGATIPHVFKKENLPKVTRDKYPEKKLQSARIKTIKGYTSYYTSSFDALYNAMAQDFEKHGPRAHQISILSDSGWWSGEWPKLTGKILGRHRIAVLNVPTITPSGERMLFVYDSAYSTWRSWSHGIKGVKHLAESVADKILTSFSVIEFLDDKKENKIPSEFYALLYVNLSYGEGGKNAGMIKLLQRYLIWSGFNIKAGPTGYFGEQTRQALREWQIKYLGRDYGGKYWGPVSRQKLKELIAQF